MIFNTQLPPAVLGTWMQLRCLAWDGWSTPPLSIPELASLIGIHPNRLNKHLSQLQDISALAWRITKAGKLILSFPEEPAASAENQAAAPVFPGSTISHPQDRDTLATPSYFPPQILGYLTYPEEPEGFLTLEEGVDLRVGQVNEVADFAGFEHCKVDQH
jgi:hypothetical protein